MFTCANPLCTGQLHPSQLQGPARNRGNLCAPCWSILIKVGLPTGGFIPSPALTLVAKLVKQRQRPTKAEIAEAVRFARGPYPEGDWNDRPAYRIAPLRYGIASRRLPHLLLGRRFPPRVLTIVTAAVHTILAAEFIGTGDPYNRYLAGATFMGRQGLAVPRGKKAEVLLGDAKTSLWTLRPNDIRILGTHALRAAKKLGLDPKDRDLRAFCTVAYQRAMDAGKADPPVAVPRWAMRTLMAGDHPLDHWLTAKTKVPARYHRKLRRASGLIDGHWPVGIEPATSQPSATPKATPAPTPSTSWLFTPRPQD